MNKRSNVLGTGLTFNQTVILLGLAAALICLIMVGVVVIVKSLAEPSAQIILPNQANPPMPTLPAAVNPEAQAYNDEVARLIREAYGPAMTNLNDLIKQLSNNPELVQTKAWTEDFAFQITAINFTADVLAEMDGPTECSAIEKDLDDLASYSHSMTDHMLQGIAGMDPDEVRLATSFVSKVNSELDSLGRHLESGTCGVGK